MSVFEAIYNSHLSGRDDEISPWPPAKPLEFALAELKTRVIECTSSSMSLSAILCILTILRKIAPTESFQRSVDFITDKYTPDLTKAAEFVTSRRVASILNASACPPPTPREVFDCVRDADVYITTVHQSRKLLKRLSLKIQTELYETLKTIPIGNLTKFEIDLINANATPTIFYARIVMEALMMSMHPVDGCLKYRTPYDESVSSLKTHVPFSVIHS